MQKSTRKQNKVLLESMRKPQPSLRAPPRRRTAAFFVWRFGAERQVALPGAPSQRFSTFLCRNDEANV